jgi:hypothetical protein
LQQVASANQTLVDHGADSALEDFVTGLIGRVDLRTGAIDLVNAGNVAPYLARGPRPEVLNLAADLPLGLFRETTYRINHLTLEPGDRIVFLTDGMLERNAGGGDLAAVIAESRSLHPREAVRYCPIASSTRPATHSATMPRCYAWTGRGWHGRDFDSTHGAEQGRASETPHLKARRSSRERMRMRVPSSA